MSVGAVELAEWLAESGTHKADLADRIGADRAALWRWLAGERVPRIQYAAAIETVTGIACKKWAQSAPDRGGEK